MKTPIHLLTVYEKTAAEIDGYIEQINEKLD
jgi:hypothetical protein